MRTARIVVKVRSKPLSSENLSLLSSLALTKFGTPIESKTSAKIRKILIKVKAMKKASV